MDCSKYANDTDEAFSNLGAHLRIRQEVTEAHEDVQDAEGDHFVKCLHVVRKFGFHRLAKLENYDEQDRSGQLNCDLAPQEFLPEHQCAAHRKSSHKVGSRYHYNRPTVFIFST